MASFSDWVEGARLRTLPAACAPVIVGCAAAYELGGLSWGRAGLALVVALALQVGVNYSNDYSDGIRGTDADRQGPARLTGAGLASPRAVLSAALGCFAVAGVAGLALLWVSGQWVLILVGVAAIVAAWFYTGGQNPYGYMGVGLSELLVFVFFGLVACVGTTWTQVQSAPWWLWVSASALGLISVALLMANNIRDIPTDITAGKRTVAVRLGQKASRAVFAACLLVSVPAMVVLAWAVGSPWSLWVCGLTSFVMAMRPLYPVISGATGRALIPALRDTGLYALGWALLACVVIVLT